MGQSKLELAVGTGQWDAGLKKAQQALNSFTNSQGGLQKALEKDNGDMQKFIQMMSKVDSTANTAKGQMNDYKRVLEQLTADYDKMTDAQKKSIGQDYLNAIDAMKQKFQQAKQQADALNRSLNEMGNNKLPDIGGGGGLFGGGKLDGMLAVFGGNIMTKAAGFAASFASEIGDMVKQGVELAKAGEGIRAAFERLDRPDILKNLREATHGTVTDIELMKAAVKFNDFRLPVEELGTMLSFAQQKAKDTGQSIDYMVDSIVTGLGRKSLMILDNLGLSAAEIKEKMKQTGDMTKAVGEIIREQMASAGDYVETAADRATKADVEMKNAMEELGRTFQPLSEAGSSLWKDLEIGALRLLTNAVEPLVAKFTELGRLRSQYNIQGGEEKVNRMVNRLQNVSPGKQQSLYNQQVEAFNKYIQERQEYINDLNTYRGVGGRSEDRKKRIDAGFARFGTSDTDRLQLQIDAAKKQLSEYQEAANKILNQKAEIDTKNAVQDLETLKKKLKELEEERKKAVKAGDSELVENLTKQINTTKQNISYLDPNALKTTHTQTKQEKAAEMVATAERTYAETLQKSAIRIETGLDSTLEGKKKELSAQERLFDAYNDAYATYADPKYKTAADQAAANMKKLAEEVKTLSTTWVKGASGFNSTTMAEWMKYRKSDLSKAEYGTSDYSNIYANIADMNTIKTVLEQSMKAGIDAAQFNLEPLWEKVFDGENIPDDTWKKIIDVINKKLKEAGLDTINIDFTTGNLKDGKKSKSGKNDIQKLMSGSSSILSGIQSMGVELPKELQETVSVIQGLISVIEGVNTVISIFATSAIAANTAAVAANTTALAINTAVPSIFARGGVVHAAGGYVVPGHQYSGDLVPAALSSGEMVLNKQQQMILAGTLENGGMKNISISGHLEGETIALSVDRWGKRSGRGELAFWKNQ